MSKGELFQRLLTIAGDSSKFHIKSKMPSEYAEQQRIKFAKELEKDGFISLTCVDIIETKTEGRVLVLEGEILKRP